MNLRSVVSTGLFLTVQGFLSGGIALAPAQASEDTNESAEEPVTGQIISYACFDRAGNVVFTTINPQETVGWELGCRPVPYESTDVASPPITYFQCFDVNGGIAFNTVDEEVADDSDLFCREIGTRITTPMAYRPVHYECYNTEGTVAFTTSYPQNTYGWKPGCRELQFPETTVSQTVSDQPLYECFDTAGNVAFTTVNVQETRRWKLGCRQVQQ